MTPIPSSVDTDPRRSNDGPGVPDLHIISHESQIDPDPGPELFPPKKDTKTDPDPGSFHGSKKIRIQIPDPDPTSKDPDPDPDPTSTKQIPITSVF